MVVVLHKHLIKGLGCGPASEGNETPYDAPPTIPEHLKPSLGLASINIGKKMTARVTKRVGGLLPGPPRWNTMTA